MLFNKCGTRDNAWSGGMWMRKATTDGEYS